jgi:hypothetical protein
MFDPVPDELPAELKLRKVQQTIIELQGQQYDMQMNAGASRRLGEGEEALSPLRKAMLRNLKVEKIYRETEKKLLAELKSANDRAFGASEPVATDGVVVER